MKFLELRSIAAALALSAAACLAGAQNATPAYLDTSLPSEQRAADLVRQMTLDEKVTQLVNQSRPIPRLNVPLYDWWSEALHGVLHNGTTEFPEPIGLAATFDTPAIHNMAIVIGTEGRIMHVQAVRNKENTFLTGLDFWPPTSTSFAIPAGAAARKPTAKTPSSPRAWP